jgi:preprotein translocase subunit YajC
VTLLIVMVALFAVMWLLLIRPQRRRQAQQAQMLSSVEVGDEILTAGGVYGEVKAIEEDELQLEIAPGTTVRLDRRAVAAVFESEEEESGAGEAIEGETAAETDSSATPRS